MGAKLFLVFYLVTLRLCGILMFVRVNITIFYGTLIFADYYDWLNFTLKINVVDLRNKFQYSTPQPPQWGD